MAPNSLTRIVLFSGDVNEHVCPVLRVVKPAEAAGIEVVHGNEWLDGKMRYQLEPIESSDLVVIQRDFPAHEEAYQDVLREAKRWKKSIVYDIDDLLIELPQEHPDSSRYRPIRLSLLRATAEADMLTVASSELASRLGMFNSQAVILPNYLLDEVWAPEQIQAKPEDDRQAKVSIGYMGSQSHRPDIEMIQPVLDYLIENYGEAVEFKFWGILPPDGLRGNPSVSWEIPGIVSYLYFAEYFRRQECDIFIAPLKDTTFNRAKSGLKFLEYSALGVPGVYADLPPYRDVVQHGENGFLATSLDEWRRYLDVLIEDSARRHSMGINARNTVQERYMLSKHAAQWRRCYSDAMNSTATLIDRKFVSASFKLASEWHRETEDQLMRMQEQINSWQDAIDPQFQSAEQLSSHLVSMEDQLKSEQGTVEQLRKQLTRAEDQLRSEKEAGLERDQTVDQLEEQLEQTHNHIAALEGHINSLTSGISWQMAKNLKKARARLIPYGSKREALYFRLFRSPLSKLKQLVKSVVDKGVRERAAIKEPDSLEPPGRLEFRVAPGRPYADPAIACIIRVDKYEPDFLARVETWLQNQTIETVEIIVWDERAAEARALGNRAVVWEAKNWAGLANGLSGRYVIFADQDLIGQSEIYLESNLIALEGEELHFTVNTRGNPQWLRKVVESGYLPGASENPFSLQVWRKDLIREGLALDLSDRLLSEGNSFIGKILTHTVGEGEAAEPQPIHLAWPDGVCSQLRGAHLVVKRRNAAESRPSVYDSHPIDSVIPTISDPSDEPTLLMLMPFLAVGGAERLHLHILDFLKDEFRFAIATAEGHDPSKGTTVDDFRAITPFVYPSQDFLEPHLFFSFLSYLIKRLEVDILYIANGSSLIYDVLPHLKNRFPELRTVAQVYHQEIGWIGRYSPSVIRSIDCHIGGTPAICQAYVDRGASTGDVYLVEHAIKMDEADPSGYSSEEIATIRKGFGVPVANDVVTFVARMHPQKRPMDFIELARRFKNEPITFLMVGDGPLAKMVDDLITQLSLENIIRSSFYSPVSDIYAITDVLLIPSEYEATPLVLLESQAMGIPVVATDVGNIDDVVTYSEGGVIVENIGDVNALAKGIRKALAMDLDQARIRRKIEARYSVPMISEKYRQAFVGDYGA